MHDEIHKFRYYRILIGVLAFAIVFELVMLALAIPMKTTFIATTLYAVGLLNLYLIVFCFRLIRELQKNAKNK